MMLTALFALQAAAPDPALADYAARAPGRFSTAAQHRADPRYDEVEARIVRIWPERTDGAWFYQEQAIVNQPGLTPDQARARPYFQFVGRVVALGDGVLRRDNYRVRDPGRFAGANIASLTPADLGEAGCHNRIERVGAGAFIGRTESCANAYRGAVSMRSLSITMGDVYLNWDRGFDAEGRRVWGPEWGGYRFERVRE